MYHVMIVLKARRFNQQFAYGTRRYHFVAQPYKMCDQTSGVSHSAYLNELLLTFKLFLIEESFISGESHRRLLEIPIINFQALSERENHSLNWLKEKSLLLYEPASQLMTRALLRTCCVGHIYWLVDKIMPKAHEKQIHEYI